MIVSRFRHTRITVVAGLTLAASHSTAALSDDDRWQFTVGAGVISSPEYPGAADNKTKAVPMISATYGRYFIGGAPGTGVPMGIGVNLYQDTQWRFGVAIGSGLGKSREESDNARLRGLGNIDSTARGSVFASYTGSWYALRANVTTDIGGKDQGTLASMDLEARYAASKSLMLTAGPGFTWADKDYTHTFFGIDAAQSARSGLAKYDAKGGINSVRFSIGANYRLTPNWSLSTRVTASELRGDAVKSPITADKSQTSVGLFAAYRF
jgi:outer membrane protein